MVQPPSSFDCNTFWEDLGGGRSRSANAGASLKRVMLDAENPPEALASDRDSIPWRWKLQKVEVPDHALMFVGRHFEDRFRRSLRGSLAPFALYVPGRSG